MMTSTKHLCLLPAWLLVLLTSTALGQDPASKPKDSAPVDPKSAETDEEAIALANRIEKMVEEVRGLKFKEPVKKGIYDKERLAKFLDEQIKKEKLDEQFGWQEKAYKLFGLIPESMDMEKEFKEVLLEQIGGFYDSETKELRVMRGFGGLAGEILMAHELCHALEDQHFDFNGIDKAVKAQAPDDDDRAFGTGAVIEGSATNLMFRYAFKRMMDGKMSQEEMSKSLDLSNPAFSSERASKAPPILFRPLSERYMAGMAFLARGAALGGAKRKDVKTAFLSPPLSSEQVIHNEKYWDPDKLDLPQSVKLADLSASFGEGWKRLGTNVLGEIGVAILTTEPPKDDEKDAKADPMAEAMKLFNGPKTTEEATGWDGDRFDLYAGPGGLTALLWVSVWDTEDDARDMGDWIMAKLGKKPGLTVQARQRSEKGKSPILGVIATKSSTTFKESPRDIVEKALTTATVVEETPLKRELKEAAK
jgi:hypothetical protein